MCGKDKENEEDALIDILKSLVGECKSIHTNKNIRVKAPSCGTNKVQGLSFVLEDEEGDILGALPCQLPPKELNPGSFTLPCTIGSVKNSRKYPVKIDKFLFPFDFMIIDMPREPDKTVIMGRPFLATIYALIDVFEKEISLGIGEDRIKFDMDRGVSHSKIPVKKIYMETSVHEEEYFNPLEIENDTQVKKPQPRDYSFEEWLKIKLGHTNVSKLIRNEVLNEWLKDSFDVEIGYGITVDDPYSRRFDEYKEKFDSEIEQLSNEYDLRVGFEEEEQWESGIETTCYTPPFVKSETIKVK
nr:hypothetical protein [Tanacetum cinerariifolium]